MTTAGSCETLKLGDITVIAQFLKSASQIPKAAYYCEVNTYEGQSN